MTALLVLLVFFGFLLACAGLVIWFLVRLIADLANLKRQLEDHLRSSVPGAPHVP